MRRLRAASWVTIQRTYFPGQSGVIFQNRIKDKWRVLRRSVRNRDAVRAQLPEELWARIESLVAKHSWSGKR